jgi:hypothetical protein
MASTKSVKQGRKPHARPGEWQEPFLDALAEHGCISAAANDAGVSVRAVQKERIRNEDFALGMKEAMDYAFSSLEQECDRRARDQFDEDGYLIRAGSDNLLMFRIKRFDHEYRDNWVPATSMGEGVAQVIADVMNEAAFEAGLDPEQHRAYADVFARRLKAFEEATT